MANLKEEMMRIVVKKNSEAGASEFVRMKGLEPPRLTAPDPKSGAATNYATSAIACANVGVFFYPARAARNIFLFS